MVTPSMAETSPSTKHVPALKVVAVALAWGTLANLVMDGPSTWSKLPGLSARGWVVMMYLTVICTLVGYSVWYLVIRETEVNLAAMTILLQPAVGVFLAAVTVGEALHWGQLWGLAAIVLGLVIGLNLEPRRSVTEETPSAAL